MGPTGSRDATPACTNAIGDAPSWCDDIPPASRQDTPYCAGPAPSSCATRPSDPRCVNSGWQPTPSWCADIPAVARGYTPQCAGSKGPTYCYDIPAPYRANVAECAGASSEAPSWCNDIPSASRDYTPDCAGAGNTVPN